MLPLMDKPKILDIGCGSGMPTLELARLSKGDVTGIDTDQSALDILTDNIKEAGLTGRVQAVNRSIFNMDFNDASFNIIWSEGSIYVIGFKRGLQEWRRFLKPSGYLVVHDERSGIEEKLEQIPDCGYELLGHFILGEDIWWTEYFTPLANLVHKAQVKHADDTRISKELRQAQEELDMFRKNPEKNSSVFFVMKKR